MNSIISIKIIGREVRLAHRFGPKRSWYAPP